MKFAVVLTIMLACASAWSASPGAQTAGLSNRKPEIDQRGTESAPLFVKGEVTTKESEEGAKERAAERKIKEHVDESLVRYTKHLAIATYALFIFTAGLFAVTYKLSKDGKADSERQSRETIDALRVAKDSADAAKASVQAYVASQRAWVNITVGQFNSIKNASDESGPIGGGHGFQLQFQNFGHTPARIYRIYIAKEMADASGVVPTFQSPVISGAPSILVPGIIQYSELIFISENDFRAISNEKILYVYGRIDYKDIFEESPLIRHSEVCFGVRVNGSVTKRGADSPNWLANIAGPQNTIS